MPVCSICEKIMRGRPHYDNCTFCWHSFPFHRSCLSEEEFLCQICRGIQRRQVQIKLKRLDMNDLKQKEIFDETEIPVGANIEMNAGDDPSDKIHQYSTPDVSSEKNTFEIVSGLSQKGKSILIHDGYFFCVKEIRGSVTIWRCCVRNSKVKCKVKVRQTGDLFSKNDAIHNHEKENGEKHKRIVKQGIKKEAIQKSHQSGKTISEYVMVKHVKDQDEIESLPCINNCTRLANRTKAKYQPKEPTDINFILEEPALPTNFLLKDVSVDNERVILFATETQLQILNDLDVWFIDGTFKCVRKPFFQLVSIHGFLKEEDEIKQVPLLFSFTSSKHKKIYETILTVSCIHFHCTDSHYDISIRF